MKTIKMDDLLKAHDYRYREVYDIIARSIPEDVNDTLGLYGFRVQITVKVNEGCCCYSPSLNWGRYYLVKTPEAILDAYQGSQVRMACGGTGLYDFFTIVHMRHIETITVDEKTAKALGF